MKPKRIKATGLLSTVDFEMTVDRLSFIQTELRKLDAERDGRVQLLIEEYGMQIDPLMDELKAKAALCEKYAEEHRAELLPDEKKSKSAETHHSIYGFRMATKSVVLLSKKCSWDGAVAILKAFKLALHVRTVEVVNKESILEHIVESGREYSLPLPIAKGEKPAFAPLSSIGLKINQAETFYIEPKVEGGTKIKTEAA